MLSRTLFNVIRNVLALIGLLFLSILIGMQFSLLSIPGNSKDRDSFFISALDDNINIDDDSKISNLCKKDTLDREHIWMCTNEASIVFAGLNKDNKIIDRVSIETGINRDLLHSVVIAEQLRFFTSEREAFKKWFEPLKILGTMSQFSLGVSGIKPNTAKDIEKNLIDKSSPFYIGGQYNNLLFTNNKLNSDSVIFNRLTDNKDHYYSYLYTALFLKQVIHQWELANIDISEDAGVLGTIFNLGFSKSIPNDNPQIGGSVIYIGGEEYDYGELSKYYYDFVR